MKWVIRAGGSDVASVEAGDTIEIGRKPLRPVSGGRYPRVEIPDDTRSMSKRHAEFSVKSNGAAFLRDLNSTNGTYWVRTGSELLRLPGGTDFQLQGDVMHMQFGDVPLDFVCVTVDDTTEGVANLFDYAVDGAPVSGRNDMSVDDILNLRAGEPTDMFNADMVQRRATELRNAENQTFAPFESPLNPPSTDADKPDQDPGAQPRDLFADAQDIAAGKMKEPAPTEQPFVPEFREGPRHAAPKGTPATEPLAPKGGVVPVDVIAAGRPVTPAVQAPVQNQIVQQPAPAAESSVIQDSVAEAVTFDAPVSQNPPVDARLSFASVVASEPTPGVEETSAMDPIDAAAFGIELPSRNEAAHAELAHTEPVHTEPTHNEPAQAEPSQGEPAQDEPDYSRFQRPADPEPTESESIDPEPTVPVEQKAYTPAFEPGSVFERVKQGEFDAHREVIEAGGYTSDDARLSDDFAKQFEMARQPKLLPFLAMNPSLYDDLYAWLSAQGNADIDEALSQNPGYADYRKAVGK